MTDPRPPIWQTIAAALRTDLAGGAYAPGSRLPTEAELAARFGVNRHTVRRALADLAAAGQVRARRGAGVFVASTPTDYPIGLRTRFHQNVLASGRTPSRQMLRVETRSALAAEAEALALPPAAPVHLVEGLSLVDGQPIALFRSVFPADRFAGLPQVMARLNSVTATLAALGVPDYTRAQTRITAIAADGVLALHLHLSPGAPVLQSVAVNVDPQGKPVEYGTTFFAGERVTLTIAP
jgi:GntR family transcriptional regulator, phosphonate transport system regulatory protein